jgi:WD40 repeat protein
VEDERGGRFSFAAAAAGPSSSSSPARGGAGGEPAAVEEFYRGRINDGSPLSIREAVEKVDGRWLDDSSAADAERFVREDLGPVAAASDEGAAPSTPRTSSPPSLPTAAREQIAALAAGDERWVSKVTPDRIYGIAAHPRSDALVVGAGDKAGHVGIWKVPEDGEGGSDDDADGTARASHHLFRPHRGAASCLQWTPSGSRLYSASYDGTIRCLDASKGCFEQVFATYDDSAEFRSMPGHGMDTGHRYWTQYACLDSRFGGGSAEHCLFVSTSVGTAMHLDLRAGGGRGRVTFHEELSEKKINTLRCGRRLFRGDGANEWTTRNS